MIEICLKIAQKSAEMEDIAQSVKFYGLLDLWWINKYGANEYVWRTYAARLIKRRRLIN